MTTNEVIDACGRAPSGTSVLVRFQGVAFTVERMTIEYDGNWWVEIAPDLNTTEGVKK